jgi:hypothetical protein
LLRCQIVQMVSQKMQTIFPTFFRWANQYDLLHLYFAVRG